MVRSRSRGCILPLLHFLPWTRWLMWFCHVPGSTILLVLDQHCCQPVIRLLRLGLSVDIELARLVNLQFPADEVCYGLALCSDRVWLSVDFYRNVVSYRMIIKVGSISLWVARSKPLYNPSLSPSLWSFPSSILLFPFQSFPVSLWLSYKGRKAKNIIF